MNKPSTNYFSISLIIFWLASILLTGYLSLHYLPFTPSFPYYGDIAHYGRALASFAHFDGIHYLRLIRHGYDDTGSQAFFPIYPLLVRTLTFNFFDPLFVAVALNLSLLFSTLYLVVRALSPKHSRRFLLLFLSFPTSFYLLANYTESLFIFLVTLFFTLLTRKKYFWAALVAGIASGTRVVGVFLALSLLVELIQSKQSWWLAFMLLLLSICGLLGYSGYLYHLYGDPLKFVHVMSMFGVGRSTGEIILLPQLLYRYFRILSTSPLTSLIGLRALWELTTLALVSVWLYFARHVLPLPALVFCLGAIIFPTLSGTLSSFPRYVLVAIPLYVAIAKHLSPRWFYPTLIVQYGILIAAVALFVQGLFIA